MTTEIGKEKKTRKAKVSTDDAVSCDCDGRIKALEAKVDVLAQYMKTFNIFLNQNMISNTADSVAEQGLNEVLGTYPA
jgi:hypothetical protein